MIDLHLLLRISHDDFAFRTKVLNKIHQNTHAFSERFKQAMLETQWNNCFYLLQGFHNQITPYGQVSFLEEMNRTLTALLYAETPSEKRSACERMLDSVEAGLERSRPLLRPPYTLSTNPVHLTA